MVCHPKLYAVPLFMQGWGENDRGVSYTFGPDSVTEFLQKHDLDLICRAHQVIAWVIRPTYLSVISHQTMAMEVVQVTHASRLWRRGTSSLPGASWSQFSALLTIVGSSIMLAP